MATCVLCQSAPAVEPSPKCWACLLAQLIAQPTPPRPPVCVGTSGQSRYPVRGRRPKQGR